MEGEVWRLEVSEARRLRALEEESRHFKHALAESTRDVRALKAVLSKSSWPCRLGMKR